MKLKRNKRGDLVLTLEFPPIVEAALLAGLGLKPEQVDELEPALKGKVNAFLRDLFAGNERAQ